jgi:hypothetical protein
MLAVIFVLTHSWILWYVRVWQSSPVYPSWQRHSRGLVQYPCWHPGSTWQSVHVSPAQPRRHLQVYWYFKKLYFLLQNAIKLCILFSAYRKHNSTWQNLQSEFLSADSIMWVTVSLYTIWDYDVIFTIFFLKLTFTVGQWRFCLHVSSTDISFERSPDINKSELQVTYDLICFTLPAFSRPFTVTSRRMTVWFTYSWNIENKCPVCYSYFTNHVFQSW